MENGNRYRQYPEIKVGDEVRVTIKKDTKTQGYFPKWSPTAYKVLRIKDNYYTINDEKRKVYQRREILKVVL